MTASARRATKARLGPPRLSWAAAMSSWMDVVAAAAGGAGAATGLWTVTLTCGDACIGGSAEALIAPGCTIGGRKAAGPGKLICGCAASPEGTAYPPEGVAPGGTYASAPADWRAWNCCPFCASSTTWKKLASSAMLPNRFQTSPVRLISSSRLTFRSTIHFWSVVSSLKLKTFPFDWRTFHSLSLGAALAPGMLGTNIPAPAGGAAIEEAGETLIWPLSVSTGMVTTGAFRFTLKMWPQVVHFTV